MLDFRFLTRFRAFSISLTVEPEAAGTELFGKTAGDLQENIVVGTDSISGILKYVTGYTGFSSDPEMQQGNYIALKFGAPEGSTTTVEIIGGISGPVTLDSDMNWVGKIASNTQKIQVVTTTSDAVFTKTFVLTNLVLTPAG